MEHKHPIYAIYVNLKYVLWIKRMNRIKITKIWTVFASYSKIYIFQYRN